MWNFWICLDCWKRYECETRYTTEFVTILNKCDFERDENVKWDQTIEFVTLLNLWNYEWDMSIKLEKTSKFANCWINGIVE